MLNYNLENKEANISKLFYFFIKFNNYDYELLELGV